MAETSIKALKAILETIREQADFALKQLQKRPLKGKPGAAAKPDRDDTEGN